MKLKSIILTIILLAIVALWIYLIVQQGFGTVFWIGIAIICMIGFWAWLIINARKEFE